MDERELKRIAALYFGLTPTPKIPKNVDFEVLRDFEGDIESAKKLKIRWENHMGAETGVARLSPMDIMHYLGMKNTGENYRRAVDILKGLAKLHNLPLLRVGDRYLLVNPEHRR